MRKPLIIFYAVACTALLVVMMWPFKTQLSDSEIQRISAVVRKHPDEPIVSVRPYSPWRVHVTTGVDLGPLSGGGHFLYLRRGFGGWHIYESTVYIR